MEWVKEIWTVSCAEDLVACLQCCSDSHQTPRTSQCNALILMVPRALGLQEEEGWKRVLEEHRDTALPSAEAQLPCQTGYVEPVQEEHQETALHSAEAEVPSQTGDVAAAQGGDAQEAAEGDAARYHCLCS